MIKYITPLGTFHEGDILLVHTNGKGIYRGFVPRAIRAITESYWNHAAILLNVNGELYVFESIEGGPKLTTRLDDYLVEIEEGEREVAVVGEVFDDTQLKNMYNSLPYVMSSKYDWFSLLWFQLWRHIRIKLSRLFGFRKDFKYRGKKHHKALKRVFCSELVAFLRGYKDFWTMVPADIEKKEVLRFIYK
jgi:hypothetical protein